MKLLRSGDEETPLRRWLGGLGPRELLLRSWRNGREHDVQGQAARLAFFFVLALFPLLLLLMTLLGFALQSASLPEAALQRLLSAMAPASASALVDATLREVRHAWSPGRFWFALILMVWSASQGMRAAILAVNVAYGVRHPRPWLRRQAVSALLTVAILLLLAATLMLLLYGRRYSAALSDAGFATVASLWPIGRWILIIALALTAFDVLYRWAPNLPRPTWRWLMPGTVGGVVLWLLASLGLQLYVRHVDRLTVTYGSISSVVALLLWLYLTGLAFLAGAELNAEIERAAVPTEPDAAGST
ncbi:MAG: YihY/virulence factor BrkB family protein [Caldimonas sp.]